MIVDKNIASYFEVLNIDTHDKFFRYTAYLLIAFGVFVFLVGFCGCCGAIRGSKCLLGMYIFFLVLIFAGEIAAGVLAIIYKVKIEEKVESTLEKSIKEKYGPSGSATITEAWDFVQIQLECCGGKGPNDYNGSTFAKDPNKQIPLSCCVLTNKKDAYDSPDKATSVNITECQTKQSEYHTKGCKDSLINWANKHTGILIGVAIGIGSLQLFGIIVAACLCRQVDREEKY